MISIPKISLPTVHPSILQCIASICIIKRIPVCLLSFFLVSNSVSPCEHCYLYFSLGSFLGWFSSWIYLLLLACRLFFVLIYSVADLLFVAWCQAPRRCLRYLFRDTALNSSSISCLSGCLPLELYHPWTKGIIFAIDVFLFAVPFTRTALTSLRVE